MVEAGLRVEFMAGGALGAGRVGGALERRVEGGGDQQGEAGDEHEAGADFGDGGVEGLFFAAFARAADKEAEAEAEEEVRKDGSW